jgi:uncharacterized surface protein with fasciclin (FAS1) repeats
MAAYRSSLMRRFFFAPVLIGLAALLVALPAVAKEKGPKMKDIADTIDSNPILQKFAKLVQGADLGTFLSSRGPFTVFVPTDSAFAAMQPGMFEVLLEPQNKERLQDLVMFHIVDQQHLSAMDLSKLKTLTPSQGPPLLLRVNHLGVQYVMKAKVTHADIKCANGVIHEIDAVLTPPDSALPAIKATPPSPPPAPDNGQNAPAPAQASTNAPPDTNNIPVAPIAKPADTR